MLRALMAVLLLQPAMAATARPLRVASINPCIDAVLMRVADPDTLVAISHFSQDPRATSVPLDWARQFRVTSGTAEEIVALRPDLVFSGSHVQPATVAALRRVGVKLIQYPVPDRVSESVAQVRDIASRVGHPERGSALAGAIEAAAAPVPWKPVPALIWEGGGLTPGKGTLPDELLGRAGFRNVSADFGLKKWDVLGLEPLIARPPRVMFSPAAAEVNEDRLSQHPAIRRLSAHVRVEPYPARLMSCGGPTIIEAAGRLKTARRNLWP